MEKTEQAGSQWRLHERAEALLRIERNRRSGRRQDGGARAHAGSDGRSGVSADVRPLHSCRVRTSMRRGVGDPTPWNASRKWEGSMPAECRASCEMSSSVTTAGVADAKLPKMP